VTGGAAAFGSFQIVSEVARGGQGAVYRALHGPSGRHVALKLLTDSNARAVKRFRQEARVLVRLQHPNVLRVIDHGEHEGTPYLATELVEGSDLSKWVELHGLPPPQATARLLATIALALEYCHGRGVVHRDVKPANVLVEQGSGRPVLIDFGLVKRDASQMHLASLDASVMSANANVKGTPGYMSPEQVNPKDFGEVGPRADVYGIGALLYFLLTGKAPFEGRAMVIVMRKVTRKAPVDPRQINANVPEALAALCMRALAKQPSERPASAAEFAAELCRAVGIPLPVVQQQQTRPPSDSGRLPSDSYGALSSSGSGTFSALPARLPTPGQVFAGCRIEAEIGRGGAGAVYVAQRPDGSRCAIKVVLGDMTDEHHRQRFLREAQVGKELQHPGIVQVLSRGEDNGQAFLIMELVEGGLPLDEYVRENKISIPQRVQLILQVAQALEVAHGMELIHRDLKPDNVLVTPAGEVKVLDFGLALHLDKERLTLSGAILGTISYMAPEQVMGQAHDSTPMTDVWALGVMLYELVKGELPFRGGTSIEVMAGIIDDHPEDPCAGVEGAPPELSAVIRVALSKAPESRYPNAAAFGRDLVAASSGSGNVSAVYQLRAENRHRKVVQLLMALAVAVLVLLGASYAVVQSRKLDEGELRERLGTLKEETRKLFAKGDPPLAERGAGARRLRVELDAMLSKAKEGVDTGRVEKLKIRLTTMAGLSALAAGELEAAKAAYADVKESPIFEVGALAGGLGAVGGGEPEASVKQLSRALQRGLVFPELRTWRLQLRARGPRPLPASIAEEVLGDLRRLERSRAATDAEGAMKGAAQLALGQIVEAEATLASLASPPASLRWGVALALAPQGVDKTPKKSFQRIAGLPDPVPKTPAAVALARQAQNLLAAGLVTNGKLREDTYRELLPLLQIVGRLQPAEPIPAALRETLLRATDVLMAGEVLDPMRDFSIAFAEARPNDVQVQQQVGLLSDWVYNSTDKLLLLPALRRAVALTVERSKKLALRVKLAVQLGWVAERRENVELGDEAIALSTELLKELDDTSLRAWAHLARGGAYRGAKDLESALREFDAAIELQEGADFFYMRAKTLWELGRNPTQNFDDAYRFVSGESPGSGFVRHAMTMTWTLFREHGDSERMASAIRSRLAIDPQYWTWWPRLALLQLELEGPEKAQKSLESALEWLNEKDAALRPRLKKLVGRLKARDQGVGTTLATLVAELDAR
jgi:serine/threonine protein kinase/tetratricopeptide (TPR) repeat protein